MIIFGGTLNDGSTCNETHCYDIGSASWVHIETIGTPPPPRCGISGFQHGDHLFLFGGYDKKLDKVYNDLWCLELSTFQWLQVFFSGNTTLAPRYYHSFHYTNDGRLFLLGGRNDDHELCDHVEEFNLRASSVSMVFDGQQSPAMTISRDCLASALLFCHAIDLSKLGRVCKRWYHASRNEALWYAVCKRHQLLDSVLSQDSCKPVEYRKAFLAASLEVQQMKASEIAKIANQKNQEVLKKYASQLHHLAKVNDKNKNKDEGCVLQ